MSPHRLRRFRAERLLRQEFSRLRARVLGAARARLRANGMALDESDLEACYAQAWHGLYTALLEGHEVANPRGWLTLVTFRRAVEEHRARSRHDGMHGPLDGARVQAATAGGGGAIGDEVRDADLAEAVDDRHRLWQLFEALRARLGQRELQAACLCYLQGLTRAEAAQAMGIGERRMRRLMEGRGPGRPGVAAKVGALAETIREGGWCEEQASLMRGLAFGILDPGGERYRLALVHSDGCPACRAYVASLRGLAALLPPVPALLHAGLAAGGLGELGARLAGGHALAAGTGSATTGASGGAGSPLAGTGGLLPASGGAAGGGWLLAGGGAGAKLAAGCVLALGVGAGCVTLGGPVTGLGAGHGPAHAGGARGNVAATRSAEGVRALAAGTARSATPKAGAAEPAATDALPQSQRASREFGLESDPPPAATVSGSPPVAAPRALAASRDRTGSAPPRRLAALPVGKARADSSASTSAATVTAGSSAATSSAQREFAPG